MTKTLLFFVLSFIFFSCKKEVIPTSENITSIINSNKYKITIDIVGGNIAGSFTDQLVIRIDDYQLDSKSEYEKLSKKLNKKEKDSLKSILKRLAKFHRKEKIPLKFGGCTARDQNYTIESDSIKMRIKPKFGNGIYYEILELIKPLETIPFKLKNPSN